jgi:transposase-like protein
VRARQIFSKEFKDSIVQKVLNRGDVSIREVCEREGVSQSKVGNWLRACATVPGMKKSSPAKTWSAEAKLKFINETSGLSESDLGLYLRREGLYSHQVNEWRGDVMKSLDGARTKPQVPKRDERDRRIKELEHDLARMEKALAEASVRMMLQKKADLFWATREAEKK